MSNLPPDSELARETAIFDREQHDSDILQAALASQRNERARISLPQMQVDPPTPSLPATNQVHNPASHGHHPGNGNAAALVTPWPTLDRVKYTGVLIAVREDLDAIDEWVAHHKQPCTYCAQKSLDCTSSDLSCPACVSRRSKCSRKTAYEIDATASYLKIDTKTSSAYSKKWGTIPRDHSDISREAKTWLKAQRKLGLIKPKETKASRRALSQNMAASTSPPRVSPVPGPSGLSFRKKHPSHSPSRSPHMGPSSRALSPPVSPISPPQAAVPSGAEQLLRSPSPPLLSPDPPGAPPPLDSPTSPPSVHHSSDIDLSTPPALLYPSQPQTPLFLPSSSHSVASPALVPPTPFVSPPLVHVTEAVRSHSPSIPSPRPVSTPLVVPSDSNDELSRLRRELEESRSRERDLELRLDEYRVEDLVSNDQRSDLRRLQYRLRRQDNDILDMERDVSTLEHENRALEDELSDLRATNRRLQLFQDRWDGSPDSRGDRADLLREIQLLEARIGDLELDINQADFLYAREVREFADFRSRQARFSAVVAELETRLSGLVSGWGDITPDVGLLHLQNIATALRQSAVAQAADPSHFFPNARVPVYRTSGFVSFLSDSVERGDWMDVDP